MSRSFTSLALGILLCVLGATQAAGQLEVLKTTTPEARAEAQTRFMATRLKLSPRQLQAVDSMNRWAAGQAEPILKGSSNRFMLALGLRSIRREQREKLGEVLSPDPLKLLGDLADEMREYLLEQLRRDSENRTPD